MEELDATVRRPIRCSAGFDYVATKGECVRHTLGGGSTSGGSGNSGNSGSSGGGNTNHHNNQPTVRTVEFALSCTSPTRGSGGSCSVATPDSAGVTMSALEFEWSSTAGGGVDKTLGKSSWSGTAVADVRVRVTISDPAGAVAGATESATAAVKARTWTFTPPTPASASSGYGGAGWAGGKWGQHDSGSTTVPGVLAGTGPWEKLYTGDAPPVHNKDNAITLHADFDTTGSRYPGANGVACFAAASSAASASVVAVNAACGTTSQLSNWEGMALAHERDHATSGDRCLRSATTSNKIRELEAITGDNADKVRDRLAEEWSDFWNDVVLPAFEGGLSVPTSPVFWEYRLKGSWKRHAVTGGRHGGTNGC